MPTSFWTTFATFGRDMGEASPESEPSPLQRTYLLGLEAPQSALTTTPQYPLSKSAVLPAG